MQQKYCSIQQKVQHS